MKRNRRATMARKAFALLMVLAIATGSIFATPLNTTATVGDTKTYNSNYKASEPQDISEGWVIRTAKDAFCVANEDISLEFGPNSLARIESLDKSLEIYLLDGSVIASSEKSGFTVKTPVTVYSAEAGTILMVISDNYKESGYVEMGSAQADNKLTKAVTDIDAGTYIDNSYSNFVPEKTDSQTFMASSTAIIGGADAPTEIIIEQQPEVVETEPVELPATEQTESVQDAAMVRSFTFENLEITLEAYIGKAFIKYPTYVTDIEVINAASAAYDAYGSMLDGIFFEIVEPGLTVVTYPETYGPAEFAYAVELIENELPCYLIMMIGFDIDPLFSVEETPIEEIPAEEEIVEVEQTEEVVDTALRADFNFYGLDASLSAYIGEAYVTYPTFVTDSEIADAAAAAFAAYPELLADIYFEILQPGLVKVTYPQTYGPAEFDYAVALLNVELPYYLAQLFAAKEQTVEVAVETPAEEPVATVEQAAQTEVVEVAQQPVAEPAPETLKTALETVSKEEAAAQVKKDNAFRFGAKVSVTYGVDNGTPYSSIGALKEKVGTYKKGLVIGVDPYLTSKSLTFGLHVAVSPFDLAGSFQFNPNGITGWANTIMSYVSVFRFQSGNFTISADRDAELAFTSPISTELNSKFNKTDNLLGTMSVSGKNFSLYAFIDDLQLSSKLAGKDQFMGARAAFNFNGFEIGASAVANISKGLKATAIYPAVDAKLPIRLGSTTITVEGGAAAQVSAFAQDKIQGYMAEAKATIENGAISIGMGAAYNNGKYFHNVINNGPCTVTSQFSGKAVDVILSAGINTKAFRLNAEITTPFAIESGSRLVYHTVKTADGSTKSISADTFTVQADLMVGAFTFSAGAAYDGLSGRLADAAKALINKSNRRAAIVGLVDPMISTYYAVANLSVGMFDIWARADYARINGSLTLPVSVGLSVKF